MYKILQGDCLETLKTLPDCSVQMCVTSPPYFGLRDYGTASWEGGDEGCDHKDAKEKSRYDYPMQEGSRHAEIAKTTSGTDGAKWKNTCPKCGAIRKDRQIGLEETPEAYINKLVEVFREVRRVLKPDGICWINLGDSYVSNPGDRNKVGGIEAKASKGKKDATACMSMNKHGMMGLKPKDLMMIPARVALALQADGWWLRSEIIWSKPNPMPESVQGSHYSRHRVTIEEYERLSDLRKEQRGNQNGSSNLPNLQAGEISNCQTPLSEKREGARDSEGAGTTPGCKREAETIFSIRTGVTKQQEVSTNSEGIGEQPEEIGKLSDEVEKCGRGDNSNSMAGDIRTSQLSMLLLQEAQDKNDVGPCDTIKQGRKEYTGECSTGLSELQLQEEGQDNSSLLVDCPGCELCEKHDGYILHLSAGRCTKSHEYIFLLTKSSMYFYDSEAIKTPTQGNEHDKHARVGRKRFPTDKVSGIRAEGFYPMANKRDVWTVNTFSYKEAHFATFPPDLIEPCILAGTSEKGECPKCGKAWVRVVDHTNAESKTTDKINLDRNDFGRTMFVGAKNETIGWQPQCECGLEPVPQTVLDPFNGSGTTGAVSIKHHRNYIGCELNPDYIELTHKRLAEVQPTLM